MGDVVSMAGDWFTYVAMSQLAVASGGYTSTSSMSNIREAISLIVLSSSHTLPRILLAPWAGVGDQYDKCNVLVATQLTRGCIVLLMVLAAIVGPQSGWWVAAIHVLHLLRMALGALYDASYRALIPEVVGVERLAQTHKQSGLAWSLIFCLAISLGGITVAKIGMTAAFVLDAASYFVCAGLAHSARNSPKVRCVNFRRSLDHTHPHGENPSRTHLNPGPANWRDVLHTQPTLVRAVFSKVPLSLLYGATWVLLTLRAQLYGAVAAPAVVLAMFHLARGVGTGVGPWLIRRRLPDDGLWLTMVGLVAVSGFVCFQAFWVPIVTLFVLGTAIGSNWVRSSTLLGMLAPPDVRSRIASLEMAAQVFAQWIGSTLVCIGMAILNLSAITVTLAIAALAGLTALVLWVATRTPTLALDSKDS